MGGPLTGVRILDLSNVVSGPMAVQILADQGADVIKIEQPGVGDTARAMGGLRNGMGALFAVLNRNKRAIVLDMQQTRARDLFLELVATADVVVQNFRPGAMARLKIDYPDLAAVNENVIYASISGFGADGPYSQRRVYDPIIQAVTGFVGAQTPRGGKADLVKNIVCDKATAQAAAQAITAALFARERNGQGQHIKLAMLDTMIAYLWPEGMSGYTLVGKEVKAARAQLAPDLIFETQDGFITAGAVSDKEWHGMCAALEKPEWLSDKRFLTVNDRAMNVTARLEMTATVIKGNTSAHWLSALDANGVPCAPVLDREALLVHEQVQANGILQEIEHPIAGATRQPRPAAIFDRTPAAIRRHAPGLGEHSREILTQAGYSDADIDKLVADGVLGEM